ncbi:MAG TPA: N-acetylmuramic acid 6-phosphate etherase [Gemmatimonadota bacterium]|nr:N-acetylmuramic acid 6-phosphate etherase [Gemmatimonadota bacterium]
MIEDRSRLATERDNPRTADIDALDARAIVERLHVEDRRAFEAVGEVLDAVAEAAERVVEALGAGGRLIYVGAGTSGRLGALDAAEIPPTFGVDPSTVQAAIAGGPVALTRAVEGAEDDAGAGAREMAERDVGPADVVFGIAAGSTTPFVLGALEEARARGAATVFLTCVPSEDVPAALDVDVLIAPRTGPEAITGSTRMKAGTATKLILNAVTTTSMVRLGKTYGNRMVDLRVTSEKLEDRGRRILRDLLGIGYEEAGTLLGAAGGRVKTALVMGRLGVERKEAERRLEDAGGFIRRALEP